MINGAQIKKIYTLLRKHGLRDEKDSIVSGFTAGKTTSVRDMNWHQAKALIAHLVSLDAEENSISKMQMKILSYAHDMNWTKRNDKNEKVIDMEHVNNWCKTYGYLKKRLDDYTYSELPKLVTQFESVYKDYLKGL